MMMRREAGAKASVKRRETDVMNLTLFIRAYLC